MSQPKSERGVSRRQMMAGVGVATGAATLGVAWPASAAPVEAVPHVAVAPHPGAGATLTAGLVHLLLDASAFDAKVDTATGGRLVDDLSGAQISVPPGGFL